VSDLICQPFELTDGTYTLRDAICLTQAQWDATTPEQLATMQQMRFSNWLAAVTAPPSDVVDEPVAEEPVDEVI